MSQTVIAMKRKNCLEWLIGVNQILRETHLNKSSGFEWIRLFNDTNKNKAFSLGQTMLKHFVTGGKIPFTFVT